MFSYKIVTIGDAGTGKTALTLRYTNNYYSQTEMTIGVDFAIKKFGDFGKLQIWDTAGQESFRSISRSYYHGSHAALIAFDLSSKRTFKNVKIWYAEFKESNNDALCILVGMKSDKSHEVNEDEINKISEELNLKYFETSALKGINVSAPFEYIIHELKHRNVSDPREVIFSPRPQEPKFNCCL
jgi:small GTP-binding protein